MKKFSLLLTVLVISGIWGSRLLANDDPIPSTIEIDFAIFGEPDTGSTEIVRPRSGVVVPLMGYYQTGAVRVNFFENLGQVVVEIVNNTTGEQWFEMGNSADGMIKVNVSGERGDYIIYIETESGATFSGNFTL